MRWSTSTKIEPGSGISETWAKRRIHSWFMVFKAVSEYADFSVYEQHFNETTRQYLARGVRWASPSASRTLSIVIRSKTC